MRKFLVRRIATWPHWAKRVVYTIWLFLTQAGKVANFRERIVVGTWDELAHCGEFNHVMHAHRYSYASHNIPSHSTILDLGCGAGYGAWYLANYLPSTVVGMDIDPNAIGWAKSHFKSKNLSYVTELNDELFDSIICFEVLEHDPEGIINTILKHLKPNGTLILSVPNSHPDSVRLRLVKENMAITNPTHKKDFEIDTLVALFQPHFENVMAFSQKPVGINSYDEYVKKRRSILAISDFTMDTEDFINSEVIGVLCSNFRGQPK